MANHMTDEHGQDFCEDNNGSQCFEYNKAGDDYQNIYRNEHYNSSHSPIGVT
jgi:hypothetical protein